MRCRSESEGSDCGAGMSVTLLAETRCRRKALTKFHADARSPSDAFPLDVGEGESAAVDHGQRLEPHCPLCCISRSLLLLLLIFFRLVSGFVHRVERDSTGPEALCRVKEARRRREREQDGSEWRQVPVQMRSGECQSMLWIVARRGRDLPHDPACEDFAHAVHSSVVSREQIVSLGCKYRRDGQPHGSLEGDKLRVGLLRVRR